MSLSMVQIFIHGVLKEFWRKCLISGVFLTKRPKFNKIPRVFANPVRRMQAIAVKSASFAVVLYIVMTSDFSNLQQWFPSWEKLFLSNHLAFS